MSDSSKATAAAEPTPVYLPEGLPLLGIPPGSYVFHWPGQDRIGVYFERRIDASHFPDCANVVPCGGPPLLTLVR